MRTRMIVLADRALARTPARASIEAAIDAALRERDGIWLARRAETQPGASAGDRFCDRALWPLCHGLLEHVRYASDDWRGYTEVNADYAERVLELITPDGAVWAHGVRWLLLASALRRYGHRGPIGLFLEAPFPGPELLDTLPWSGELTEALGGFDLIGFPARPWADRLEACLARAGRARPRIGTFPIGIEPRADATEPAPAELDLALHDRRLILAIDHLDPAGGILDRLLAFEQLLERSEDWRGRVILAQIAAPPRVELLGQDELQRRIEQLVGRINGRFGEADWVPIRYLSRDCSPELLAQLYRAAEVALVTPLRDGFDGAPLELILGQDPLRPAVLILSRFAAAADALDGALLTNPYHHDGVAADLDRALRMPLDERRRRHLQLADAASRGTPAEWVAGFLDALAASAAASRAPMLRAARR